MSPFIILKTFVPYVGFCRMRRWERGPKYQGISRIRKEGGSGQVWHKNYLPLVTNGFLLWSPVFTQRSQGYLYQISLSFITAQKWLLVLALHVRKSDNNIKQIKPSNVYPIYSTLYTILDITLRTCCP